MPTTSQIQRVAAAMHALRPDWPTGSLVTFLTKHHADRAYADLAVAAVVVALDENTKTPSLLNEHGRWWTAAHTAAGKTERDPSRSTLDDPRTDGRPRCPIHGRHELAPPHCRACRSEELAGTRPKPVPVPDEEPSEPDWKQRAAGEATR